MPDGFHPSGTWHNVTGWHCKTMYSVKCQEHDTMSLGDTATPCIVLNVRNPSHPWRTQTCTQPDNYRRWNALCTDTVIMSTNTATSCLLCNSRPLLLPLAVLQYFIKHFHKLLCPLNYDVAPQTVRQYNNSSRIDGGRPDRRLAFWRLTTPIWVVPHS